jgi:hypothetical protein
VPDPTTLTPTRIQRRIRLSQPVSAAFVAGSARGKGRILDVSQGGIFVRSSLLPTGGTSVAASLELPSGRTIAVQGIVQWNTAHVECKLDTPGFGVRLTLVPPEYLGFVDGALSAADANAETVVRDPY